MKKYFTLSIELFAISTIGFGVIQILTGNFNKGLLPVPASIPGRTILAYSSGIILTIAGIGLCVKKWRSFFSISLGIVYLIYFIFLHLIKLSADIYDGGEWTATFEVLLLCSGAFLASGKYFTASRYALAICFIVFAILHFKYGEYIATLIPTWVPAKLFLAYFIGAGFLLTAISIFVNVMTALSTSIIGFMFLLWVVILHAPRVAGAINSEPEWTSLFVALAASGISLKLCSISSIRNKSR